jgi:hypothetical protein
MVKKWQNNLYYCYSPYDCRVTNLLSVNVPDEDDSRVVHTYLNFYVFNESSFISTYLGGSYFQLLFCQYSKQEEFEDTKRGNQNPYIEEEQTTQWPKEKVQKDKQRSTKHTNKTKDRVTRAPRKIAGELRCLGRVSSACSTSDTRCVNLVTTPLMNSTN